MKTKLMKFCSGIMASMLLFVGAAFAGCADKPDNTQPATAITDVVKVEGGKICGVKEGEVFAFKGIPYAAPPVGENRWKRPQPVKSWKGTKDCKKYGNSAVQTPQEVQPNTKEAAEFLVSNKNYSEDCLNLNVWTKEGKTDEKRPVIVYIHGGAWLAGGSSCDVYNGINIAKEGVVYVSINYRLGIFGWFAHSELIEEDEEGSSGNYGLMDIIKSLEWVKENIGAFGGDAENVTVMGQSAGASLVQNILVSPKAQGLFANVDAGSFNRIDGTLTPVADRAKIGDTFGTLAELREMTADELMDVYLAPQNLLKALSLISVCNDGVYMDMDLKEGLESGRGKAANVILGMVWDKPENNGNNDSGFAQSVEGLTSGEALVANLTRIAKARIAGGATGKTFVYCYAHPYVAADRTKFGSFHASDIPYFLNYCTPSLKQYWTDDDEFVAKTASSYLVNFVTTGNVNGGGLPEWKENTGDYRYQYIVSPVESKVLTQEQIEAFEATIS